MFATAHLLNAFREERKERKGKREKRKKREREKGVLILKIKINIK